MAKRRGGRFKKMLGLGFISFEKAFRTTNITTIFVSIAVVAILSYATLRNPSLHNLKIALFRNNSSKLTTLGHTEL
jgi:hypothetical protein